MAIKNHFLEQWHKKENKEDRRISLTEISKKSGIGWGTINRWKRSEVDRFDASVLSALCAYFECGVGDLIEYVPDEDNE